MAKFYWEYGRASEKHVRGLLAKLPVVDKAVGKATKSLGNTAEAVLAAHRDKGHSEILTLRGDVDGYVVLSDSRGEGVAMAIEFGTTNSVLPAPAPLRTAVGLARFKNYGAG